MGNLYFLGDKFITINIDNITFWGNQFKPQQIDDIQELYKGGHLYFPWEPVYN